MPDKKPETTPETFAILKPEVREAIEEAFDGQMPELNLSDLPTVVYPSAGDDRWIVKSGGGNEERASAIRGVVVAQRINRTMYLSQYGAGSTEAPDCSSHDGKVGNPRKDDAGAELSILNTPSGDITFGGACSACPLNEWESRRLIDTRYSGDGKACREGRILLILPPDRVRPVVMRLPSTAIRTWSGLAWDLVDKGLVLSRTILKFTLSAKSGETAQLHVVPDGEVDADDARALKSLMPSFKRPQLAAGTQTVSNPEEVELDDAAPV